MRRRTIYKVCATYDTETCNWHTNLESRAYPIAFIFNDLRTVSLRTYETDNDNIIIYRHEMEALNYIQELIEWGKQNNIIPIIAAYNLMFDLQPLLEMLNMAYDITACAQSTTTVYTLDLNEYDNCVLRFWDTFHLELGGLAAMGATCGLEKLKGDFNYDLIRTPETPFTQEEIGYMKRDVQVIPAYLRYILEANDYLEEEDLGMKVITKTSIVRQMAKAQIGNLKVKTRKGKWLKLYTAYNQLCWWELPKNYTTLAIRRACFRGGLTFTSAQWASKPTTNVASLDVTSMHHLFINGRYLPYRFKPRNPKFLNDLAQATCDMDRAEVLERYHRPFWWAFHIRVEFTNLRLKEDSAFEHWGIALLAMSKFQRNAFSDLDQNLSQQEAERSVKEHGWHDVALRPEFAFGKLMGAEYARVHVSEVELYAMSRVYAWDSMNVLCGEATRKAIIPPDYVTLQSNLLFQQKSELKQIVKNYNAGTSYTDEISDLIPIGIKNQLRAGTVSESFLNSYYNSTIKGSFNGIYGTQAQNIYRPDWTCEDGLLDIDYETVITPENFTNKDKRKTMVDYNYGLRIVAGSRLHLVLAIELLYEHFGSRIDILGGDTDSLKIRTDADVTDDELLLALEPLHTAATLAIKNAQLRSRELFPNITCELEHIGCFEVESNEDGTRYAQHMEAWNKARISRTSKQTHVTCAGLSRPPELFHIEKFVDNLIAAGYKFEEIAPLVLSYNTRVDNDICHSLDRTHPFPTDYIDADITDYLGNTAHVFAHESICLTPNGRWLGESSKYANLFNIDYLGRINTEIDTTVKYLEVIDGVPQINKHTPNGLETIMRGTNINV